MISYMKKYYKIRLYSRYADNVTLKVISTSTFVEFGKTFDFNLNRIPNNILQEMIQSEDLEIRVEQFGFQQTALQWLYTQYQVLLPNIAQSNCYSSESRLDSHVLITDDQKMINQTDMPLVGYQTIDKNWLRTRNIQVKVRNADGSDLAANYFGADRQNVVYQLDLVIVY
jgi:hypothetical protein